MLNFFLVSGLLSLSTTYFGSLMPITTIINDRPAVVTQVRPVKVETAVVTPAVAELPTSTPITDASFEEKVIKAKGIVVVDFWAPWCGPCLRTAPEMEKVAATLVTPVRYTR